jgi:hypothetical protein
LLAAAGARPRRLAALPADQRAAARLVLRDLGQRHLDVVQLLLQLAAMIAQHDQEGLQLRPLVAARFVHVDELLDLLQRQPEPLAAQRQLQARAVAVGVDAVAAGARGLQQPTSS